MLALFPFVNAAVPCFLSFAPPAHFFRPLRDQLPPSLTSDHPTPVHCPHPAPARSALPSSKHASTLLFVHVGSHAPAPRRSSTYLLPTLGHCRCRCLPSPSPHPLTPLKQSASLERLETMGWNVQCSGTAICLLLLQPSCCQIDKEKPRLVSMVRGGRRREEWAPIS